MAEIPFEPYTGQSKLRFWCQKVLPLVYDDSLSYYELLGKVVEYLNNTISDVSACEDNITALRDAFVKLQNYVNEQLEDFAPEVERIINEMIDSGEFGEILANTVNGLIANEYSTTQGYAQFDYVIKDDKLYCATASTSGEWDATKWRETTVGADMQLLNQRVYNLNAGQVAFNESTTYDNGTVGKKLKDLDDFDDNLNAGQVAYDNNATYSPYTVGYKINNLNNAGETILDDCNNFVLGIKKVTPTTLNMPENAYGFIESYVAQNNTWKWQLLITTQTPQKIFKRANINNTGWTEWIRIADNTDVENLQGSLNSIGNLRFISFDTTSITTQVDALGVGAFWGTVKGNTVGMPTTNAGIVRILSYSASLKRIYFYPNGSDDAEYMLEKRTSWRSWITLPTRAEVDEIRNAEIPTEVTISSVHENVTINSQKVYQTGRIVVVAMNITISQDVTTSSQLLYGFPAPIALTSFAAITNGGSHGCNIRSNRHLYNDGAITAGSWYINVAYITAS